MPFRARCEIPPARRSCPLQGISLPPQSTLNSEPESLIELRIAWLAGSARNSSPLVRASRSCCGALLQARVPARCLARAQAANGPAFGQPICALLARGGGQAGCAQPGVEPSRIAAPPHVAELHVAPGPADCTAEDAPMLSASVRCG